MRLTLLAVSARNVMQKASAPKMVRHWQHQHRMFTVVSGNLRTWEPCHDVFDRNIWPMEESVREGTPINERVWCTRCSPVEQVRRTSPTLMAVCCPHASDIASIARPRRTDLLLAYAACIYEPIPCTLLCTGFSRSLGSKKHRYNLSHCTTLMLKS